MSPEFDPNNTLKRSRMTEQKPDPMWGTAKKAKTSLLGEEDGVDRFDEPHPNHVLCGRGERTNRHPGNKAFRRVVESNRPTYHSGPRRNKALIAESIVRAVYRQNPPGCFVRYDKSSGLWVDIGVKEAIKKTSQALREDGQKGRVSTSDRDTPKDDDDNGSSFSDDDGDDRKPQSKPPPAAGGNNQGPAHGFGPAPVSSGYSGQGEHADMEFVSDDFDRMIGNLHDVHAHEADFEPLHLNEPLTDFSRSSSAGSSNMPMPTSLVFQTSNGSNGSSILSVVSRDSDSEEDDKPSAFNRHSAFGVAGVEAIAI